MANRFGTDILIQHQNPEVAARFYVETLGFTVAGQTPDLVSLEGKAINLYIERGPAMGPILEVMVEDVAAAKAKVVAAGGRVLKDEPEFPRTYVLDPCGLIYNLRRA